MRVVTAGGNLVRSTLEGAIEHDNTRKSEEGGLVWNNVGEEHECKVDVASEEPSGIHGSMNE